MTTSTTMTPGSATGNPSAAEASRTAGAPGAGAQRSSAGASDTGRRNSGPARGKSHRKATRTKQPAWVRPSALVLLVFTAVLYCWNLSISGYGNSFYAAAVQAGTKSWTALLFGSLDSGNAITVDKPPASLWIPAILGRVFGFSSWTVLLPQALMGVAAVGLLYLAVKRVSGPAAGLIAGGTLALTPVAALMFRFNNPDALLTLTLVAAAYCVVRSIGHPSWRWMALAGALIGLAFLTKMLQGFLTIPALALAYLWAANTTLGRRFAHLGAALLGLVVVAGSYLLLFQLTPTSIRPYMAGSSGNSFWELTLGYNGLGRIFGGSGNGGGGGMGGSQSTGFGGATGLLRMFGSSFGGEVAWLLPSALIALVAGLWFTRRAPRSNTVRGSLLLWGGWLLVTALSFSFMEGTIHPYYVVALAPAVAALVGIGAVELFRGRALLSVRIVLAAFVASAAITSTVLLSRDSSWLPWLKWLILVLGVLACCGIVLGIDRLRWRNIRVGAAAVVIVSILAGGLGTAAWTFATAAAGHTGSIPTSGPSSAARGGFGQGGVGTGPGGVSGQDGSSNQSDATGQNTSGQNSTGTNGPGGAGFGEGGSTSSELVSLLSATTTKWSAITVAATSAAELELASNTAVISAGGWNGSDPYPTLDEFKRMVANGEVTYFISGGMGGMGGGRDGESTTSAITTWVSEHFTAKTVGQSTVYTLKG